MARREFAGAAAATTLTGAITASTTSIPIADATNWPTGSVGPFLVVIARGTANEEKVLVTSRSGTTLTCTLGNRGYDGTTAAAHASGVAIEHCAGAIDFDEANAHVNAAAAAHAATAISFSPTGGIAATNVQTAIAELDSEKIAAAIVDAKGDIIVATAADTVARLAVGSNDQVLTADSAQASGVKWATPASSTDRAVITGFSRAASDITTAIQFRRVIEVGTGAAFHPVPVVMDRAGSIIGIAINALNARTAGTMTVEVYKNGAATGLTAVIDGTNTQYAYGVQATGLDTFVAGDRLDVRGTSASFAPATGSDSIAASITVAYS